MEKQHSAYWAQFKNNSTVACNEKVYHIYAGMYEHMCNKVGSISSENMAAMMKKKEDAYDEWQNSIVMGFNTNKKTLYKK